MSFSTERVDAAILSRMRSPVTSRSNCANEKQDVQGKPCMHNAEMNELDWKHPM